MKSSVAADAPLRFFSALRFYRGCSSTIAVQHEHKPRNQAKRITYDSQQKSDAITGQALRIFRRITRGKPLQGHGLFGGCFFLQIKDEPDEESLDNHGQ